MSARPPVDELVARTPASRDRYVDFLRAASILAVVIGHWFIGMIYWRDGVIGTTSAIGVVPWAWALTWILQVMPLFFFVGGFSNLVTYRSFERRGESVWAFLRTRLRRLLTPSLLFLGVWVVVQVLLHLLDLGGRTTWYLRGMRPPGATVPFGPLWFLAVYMAVILLSPVMIWLHRRFAAGVIVVMVVGAIGTDMLGFPAGISEARWANVAFVWLLPHQLGFFYADGALPRMSRRALALIAGAGLGALVLITNAWAFGDAGREWFPGIGHYPRSLLGTDVEPISNAYPPTIALMAMTFWSIGIAMLLRDAANRWLERRGPWKFTIVVNSVIMTLFLWHMTAYLLAVLLLWPLGLGQVDATHARWWLERPLWIAVPGVLLLGLIAVFGRFERRAPRPARVAA